MQNLLHRLCKARGITMGELARRLGYASRTSLFRLTREDAAPGAFASFRKRLEERLCLSPEEQALLAETGERMLWREDYGASREMARLLSGETPACGDFRLTVLPEGRDVRFQEYFTEGGAPVVVLFNGWRARIVPQLLHLLRARGARVRHYVRIPGDGETLIRAASSILPLAFQPGYECLAETADVQMGLIGADLMHVTRPFGNGEKRDMVIFDAPDHGFVLNGDGAEAYFRIRRPSRRLMRRVTHTFSGKATAEAYAERLSACAELEECGDIRRIKPDICLEWIPPALQERALLDGDFGDRLRRNPEAMERVMAVVRRRWRAAFSARRNVTLMRAGALWNFVRTGRTGDQFFGMRAYTRRERAEILRGILSAAEGPGGFEIRFAREETGEPVHAALYEGRGLMLLPAGTDYNLKSGYSDVLLVHEEVRRMFAEYYERALLTRLALSREESIRALQEITAFADAEAGKDDTE